MSSVSLGFATFFAIAALVFLALAFGTDHWVDIVVDLSPRDRLDNSRTYHSRHLGLFRECFKSENSEALQKVLEWHSSQGILIDRYCLLVEYEIPEKSKNYHLSDEYWAMIHLSRSTVAFLIIAMIFTLIGAVFGAVACWRTTYKPSQVAGVFLFIAAFFAVGGMAFFHGVEYIQKNNLHKSDPEIYYKNWNANLKNKSDYNYSWSYILGWVGVGLAAISAVIYIFTAWYINDKKREDELYESYSIRTNRNRPAAVYLDYEPQPVYGLQYPGPADQTKVYYLNGPPVVPDQHPETPITPVIATTEPWEYRY